MTVKIIAVLNFSIFENIKASIWEGATGRELAFVQNQSRGTATPQKPNFSALFCNFVTPESASPIPGARVGF